MIENNKEILLKDVIILPFFWFPLGGLILGVPLFVIYGTYGLKYFGVFGMIFTAMVFFAILSFLIKYLSKDVVIRFSVDNIEIEINGNSALYAKKDVLGVFSHDYDKTKTSLISFQINFKNGKKMEIVDSKFTETYDIQKNKQLSNLICTIQNEFGFTIIKKSRLRSFKKLGAFWYSKK